jgi:large subunit ribosomal protein L18
MTKRGDTRAARIRRHARLRQKVKGEQNRPRLCVFRSLNHIHAQLIDDMRGHTIASASSLESEVKDKAGEKTKTGMAQEVGLLVANRAKSEGVTQVVFDRGGYRYHGRVKALAEAVREAGLLF